MLVIIKYIPEMIGINEFADALKPFLIKGIFKRQSELKAVKFVDFVNHNDALVERHAIVRVGSEHSQKHLIKAVNNNKIGLLRKCRIENGIFIRSIAAPYVVRWYGNDRRQRRGGAIGFRHIERRRYELKTLISCETEC